MNVRVVWTAVGAAAGHCRAILCKNLLLRTEEDLEGFATAWMRVEHGAVPNPHISPARASRTQANLAKAANTAKKDVAGGKVHTTAL